MCETIVTKQRTYLPLLLYTGLGSVGVNTPLEDFYAKITLPKMYLVYVCMAVVDVKHIMTETL